MPRKNGHHLLDFNERLDKRTRRQVSDAIGTTLPVLSQILHGHQTVSANRARKLVDATRILFPKDCSMWLYLSDLRPDLWPKNDPAGQRPGN